MTTLKWKWIVAKMVPYGLFYAVPKAEILIKKGEKTDNTLERYKFACNIIEKVRKKSHTKTMVYGHDNLPHDGSFILYSNHQGKYDALGILPNVGRPCGVLWAKPESDRILSTQVCRLLSGEKIDLTNNRDKVRAIMSITEKVRNGLSFLIFPEGGYEEVNDNSMKDFLPGCFACSLKSGMPIIPVAIYDSYKSMRKLSLKWVTTEVHFLPPVMREEYEGMSKHDLANMIHDRIEVKLRELDEAHAA